MRYLLFLIAVFIFLIFLSSSQRAVHAAVLPNSPWGPHAYCYKDEAKILLSWQTISTATSYAVRVDAQPNSWDGSCSGDDMCETVNKNSILIPITPGVKYDWWVHSTNSAGWSRPAMGGFEFMCEIDVPYGLHYYCMDERNEVQLSWIGESSNGYRLQVDSNPDSQDPECAGETECIEASNRVINIPITPGVEYEWSVQIKDNVGNLGEESSTDTFKCGYPVDDDTPAPTAEVTPDSEYGTSMTPAPTEDITPTPPADPTADPTAEPTTDPAESPTLAPTIDPVIDTPTPSPEGNDPSPTEVVDCPQRTNGDANCSDTITLEDAKCWIYTYVLTGLDSQNGCRYTDFDDVEGTTILDYAIWHSHL